MNFDEMLKTLQRDYLASMPEKIALIETQIKSGAAADLRQSFHKLKGTGRTYGIPEVTELAEVVENICSGQPNRAVQAAGHAVSVLRDIYTHRQQQRPFELTTDSRLADIRKLLQT